MRRGPIETQIGPGGLPADPGGAAFTQRDRSLETAAYFAAVLEDAMGRAARMATSSLH
jgi:hypothetical protein